MLDGTDTSVVVGKGETSPPRTHRTHQGARRTPYINDEYERLAPPEPALEGRGGRDPRPACLCRPPEERADPGPHQHARSTQIRKQTAERIEELRGIEPFAAALRADLPRAYRRLPRRLQGGHGRRGRAGDRLQGGPRHAGGPASQRNPDDQPASAARRPPSACAWSRPSASRATSLRG